MSPEQAGPARKAMVKPMSVTWSASSEQNRDAFEAYRASLSDLCEVSGVDDNGRTGFHSRTTAYRFGASTLAIGNSSGQTMTRSAKDVRRSDLDQISIMLNAANSRGECDGRGFDAPGGSVQFRDFSRSFTNRVDAVDIVNLVVSRASVPAWLLSRRVHGLVMPANSAGGALVASHIRTLGQIASGLTEEEGVAAIEATFVIAERFLGNDGTVTPRHRDSVYRTVRYRAMQLLDASDPETDPDIAEVARAIGVSRSGLYRAFEDMGGVKTYVRRRRLNLARARLQLNGGDRKHIAETAAAFGFSSVSVFSREFRGRFGHGPDEVQPSWAMGRTRSPVANAEGELDGAAHELLFDWMRADEAA